MPDLAPDARDFLAAPGRHGVLATIEPDGSPLQAVVWYELEADDTILLNSLEGRRWPTNLLRDPRASFTVEDFSMHRLMRLELPELVARQNALMKMISL